MKKTLLFVFIFFSFYQTFSQHLNSNSKGELPHTSVFTQSSAPDYVEGKVVFKNELGKLVFDSGKVVGNEMIAGKKGNHYKTQQFINGLPVENAIYIQHVLNDKVISANGRWLKPFHDNLSSKAGIPEKLALQNALQHCGASVYKWQLPSEEAALKKEQNNRRSTYYPKGELVYYSGENDLDSAKLRLAYKFDIYAHKALLRQYIFIDALKGNVLGTRNLINRINVPATAITVFSGAQPIQTSGTNGAYTLRESGRGNGIETFNLMTSDNYSAATDFINSTTVWNNVNANKDQYATDAHWGTEKTWDFFHDKFGRNSIDNAGFSLISYVHYSTNYYNAYWDGFRMTYGDGSSIDAYQPLTTLDICGHEISHGLTQYTSGLVYSGESGALNEGFSDIFGTAIENYARPSKWDWIIGGDVAGFRNMANPNSYQQPDTYKGQMWDPNEEVHVNSGVLNFWFYLLSAGGSGINDIFCNYKVQGIGIDKATAIAFVTNTAYLFPTAKYDDAARYSLLAAAELYGENSNEVVQTAAAWSAVGINIEPTIPSVTASSFTVCAGSGTRLSIASGQLNGGTYWQWYSGQCGRNPAGTGSSIMVSPDSTTTYYVRAEGGCISFTDCAPVTITVLPKVPKPQITVNGPTTFCQGQTVGLAAPAGYQSYSWSSGVNTPSIVADKTGSYTVSVTDANGCVSQPSEPVMVNTSAPATVPVITTEGSTTACVSGAVILRSSPAPNYLWSTGETTPFIKVNKPGNYTVSTTTTSGCTATSLPKEIKFIDNLPPVPRLSSLPPIVGECYVALSNIPTAFDSCVGLVYATTRDPLVYNVQGNYIVNWLYSDGNGNSSSQQQYITVRDTTPPVIICPAFSGACSGNGIYSVPPVKATDNCSVDNTSFKYMVTGAANRTGTGADASGYFAAGSNTLTFSVTDINGNTSTCSTTFVISPPLAASIGDVYAVLPGGQANTLYVGYGPSSLSMTVTVSGGSGIYSYLWSNGASTKTTQFTSAIPGVYKYSLVVSDSKGCSITISKTIYVVDVRCGNKNDKVAVCKVPPGNAGNENALCLSSNAVGAQLANGSFLGSCSVSSSASLSITNTGTGNLQTENTLIVSAWPNPGYSEFHIKISSMVNLTVVIQITDVLGKVHLLQSGVQVNKIYDLGKDLKPGMYFIRAIQQNKQVVIKVLKQ